MTDSGIQHPAPDALLQFLDGELPRRAHAAVRRHVASCWKCRAEVDQLEGAIGEFMRYREKAILPSVPTPDGPWPDLRRAMERFDRDHPLPSGWLRLAFLPGRPALRLVGAFAALALACLAVAVVWTVRQPAPTPAPDPRPSVAAPAAPAAPVLPRAAAPKAETAPPPAPTPQASGADPEVLAVAALHRLGADLGEPVEIHRSSDGAVEVTGPSLPAARRREIADALAAVPGVTVRWSENPALLPPAAEPAAPAAGPSPFDARLNHELGSAAAVERLSNQALDSADAMMARAYAIRNLDDRFPAGRRAAFQHDEAAILDRIVDENRRELVRHARAVVALIESARDVLGMPKPPAHPPETSLFDAAQRVDRLVNIVFGGAATDRAPARILADLGEAAAQLKAAAGRDPQ